MANRSMAEVWATTSDRSVYLSTSTGEHHRSEQIGAIAIHDCPIHRESQKRE